MGVLDSYDVCPACGGHDGIIDGDDGCRTFVRDGQVFASFSVECLCGATWRDTFVYVSRCDVSATVSV
jgi:hypothetical protein